MFLLNRLLKYTLHNSDLNAPEHLDGVDDSDVGVVEIVEAAQGEGGEGPDGGLGHVGDHGAAAKETGSDVVNHDGFNA